VLRGQHNGSLQPYSRFSRPGPLLFLLSSSSVVHEAEWSLFQTHYFSENLVAPGIEPGPQDLWPGTLTTIVTKMHSLVRESAQKSTRLPSVDDDTRYNKRSL
jgi:hypothetical protein